MQSFNYVNRLKIALHKNDLNIYNSKSKFLYYNINQSTWCNIDVKNKNKLKKCMNSQVFLLKYTFLTFKITFKNI